MKKNHLTLFMFSCAALASLLAAGESETLTASTQDLTHIAPTGMIFVPSVGGVSHSPKEYTSPEDITNGANVLLRTVLAIDRGDLD
jgi:acetylornithine deacetylase/succinyl-diaminopimelate desuccinylase-like protein